MKPARLSHDFVLYQQGFVVAAAVDQVVDVARYSRAVRSDAFAPTTFPFLMLTVVVFGLFGQV